MRNRFIALWPLFVAVGIFLCAGLYAFWPVLGPDVVFLAPDAPIAPMSRGEAWHQLITGPVQWIQLLTVLFGYHIAYQATFWVSMGLMGIAGFALVRARGVDLASACFAGGVASFTGYFATLFCAGHRGVVDTLAWMALSMATLQWGFLTLRWRGFILTGLCWALGMATQPDIWLITLCGLVPWGIFLWVEQRPPMGKVVLRGLVLLAIFVGVAWGTGAFYAVFAGAKTVRDQQLAQAQSLTPSATDAQWEFVTNWSLPPEDLMDVVLPGSIGWSSYPMDRSPYRGRMGTRTQPLRQHTLALSAVALLAALVALCRRWREPVVWFWVGVAVIGVLLALGRFTPFYRMIYWIPQLNAIRAPVKWFHLTGLAVAVLAGYGMAVGVRRWGRWVALVGCLLTALEMGWVIRHYVFPVSLAPTALMRALPAGATVANPLQWKDFEQRCLWQGIAIVPLERAHYVVTLVRPELGVAPLAREQVEGYTLGLYRLR